MSIATARRGLVFLMGLLLFAALLSAQEPEPTPDPAPAPEVAERQADADDPPQPERVSIPVGTHLPLVLANTVSTKTAAVGDPLYFESIYPVVVNSRILVPVGSYVRGTVTHVKRPGRVKGRGELHVRFDELTLPNGYTINLSASLNSAGAGQGEEVDREEGRIKGDSSKMEDVGTVVYTTGAGTGIGAGVGGIAGNSGRGAGIGAGIGAAAGLAAVLLTRGKELELPRGTTVDIVFDRELPLDPKLTQFEWTGQGSSISAPAARERQNPLRPSTPF